MDLILDGDVKAVAELMQSNIPTERLVEVSTAVATLAPIIWAGYKPEPIQALRLVHQPITSADGPHTQSVSSV